MVLANANICDFGWKARDFALEGVDGKTYSLADVRGPSWLVVVAWPFALGRLKGAAAAPAAKVNKALVAFLACLMVAVAATSVATNLARVSR